MKEKLTKFKLLVRTKLGVAVKIMKGLNFDDILNRIKDKDKADIISITDEQTEKEIYPNKK